MLTWFKQIIAPPVFEDEDQTRKAKLLNAMQLILLGVMVVITPVLLILGPDDALTNLSILVPAIGSLLVLLYLLRHGHVELSGIVLVAMLWFIVTLNSWIYGGIRNSTNNSYFILVGLIKSIFMN